MSRFENLVGNVMTFPRKCQEMSIKQFFVLEYTHLRLHGHFRQILSTCERNVQTSILSFSLEMSRNVKKCQKMSILKNAKEIFFGTLA